MINFQQSEQLVRKQAEQIRQKLLQKRLKKQAQYQKQIKQELIKEYQQKFDQFKKQIEQYGCSQITSLDLIKQFRMGQISQFEGKINDAIHTLENQQNQLTKKKEDLQDSLAQAIQFLRQKRENEIKQKKIQMENQLQQLVKQYQERIDIQ